MNYPASVLKSAHRRIENIRKKNKELFVEQKNLIYSKVPGLYECNEEMAAILKSSVSPDADIEKLKKRIYNLSEKRKELLIEKGFDSDSLEGIYSCKKCKDEGFLGSKICTCYEKIILEEAYKLSNLEEKIKFQNFESSDMSVFSNIDEMKQIYNRALEFSTDYNTGKNNLFFIGNPGTGKTFLSSCIAKRFLDNKKSVLYLSAVKLSDIIDDSKFKKRNAELEEETEDYIDFIYNCDLLIIDDLGTEFSLPYSQSRIFDILDARMLTKKHNIISTNLGLEELAEKYSSRFTSRIIENYDVVFFSGEDIRIKTSIS